MIQTDGLFQNVEQAAGGLTRNKYTLGAVLVFFFLTLLVFTAAGSRQDFSLFDAEIAFMALSGGMIAAVFLTHLSFSERWTVRASWFLSLCSAGLCLLLQALLLVGWLPQQSPWPETSWALISLWLSGITAFAHCTCVTLYKVEAA